MQSLGSKKYYKPLLLASMSAGLLFAFVNCDKLRSQSEADNTLYLSSDAAPIVPVDLNSSGAGSGHKVSGVGSSSVPTAEALIARLKIGLQNNVKADVGNFAKSITQVKGNLPKVTDPLLATGFDQVQLLTYGACSDLTTGGTPLMKSKYNVSPTATIAENKTNLIAAGMTMVDQYVAGLASKSSASTQVQAALENLIQQISAVSSNTSTIAFMSVCIAANTAGSSLMGF